METCPGSPPMFSVAPPTSDPHLLPFLSAEAPEQEQYELDQLIGMAASIASRITRWAPAADDAFQDSMQRIVEKLRRLKAGPPERPIANYSHYVAVVASRVVKGARRAASPGRRRLHDSLRHLLRRDRAFAAWKRSNGETMCGLAAWRESADVGFSARLATLLDEPGEVAALLWADRDVCAARDPEILGRLFQWIGHPIRFADLVQVIHELKRPEERVHLAGGEREGEVAPIDRVADSTQAADRPAEWGEFLGRVWEEIRQLPPLQRIAYLLNFGAADGELELFCMYGIASIRDIGATVGVTPEQFTRLARALGLGAESRTGQAAADSDDQRFAVLWPRLPLKDEMIATMLATERQKVINLRKAARDRISRRLREFFPAFSR